MDRGLDFQGLAAALLGQARLILPAWLPGGRLQGREYVCANLRGGPGGSLSVNVETGQWADFSGDERGGDLISLYAAIEGIKQGEAAKLLADKYNYALGSRRDDPPAAKPSRLGQPPASAPAPRFEHPRFGKASRSWAYRGATGSVLFHIARFDSEGKQFVTFSWDTAERRWVMKAWPAPRPLYGLDLVAADPEKPVLVVEGEKAADAARTLTQAYIVVSWPGGAAAWRRVDWTPLHGRRVLLWPDADRHVADTQAKADKYGIKSGDVIPYDCQPGPAAMLGIADLLHAQAVEVKIIDVGLDPERADGYDAADAAADGIFWADFIEWAKPRTSVYAPKTTAEEPQLVGEDDPEPPDLGDLPPGQPNLYSEWEKLGVAVTQNGSPICNIDNALRVIAGRDEFKDIVWYDEFHKRYLTRFDFETFDVGDLREWGDVDELKLTTFMQRQLGLRRISDDMVHKAAIVYAHQHVRNEPRDWMAGLKWDGTARVERFFADALGAEESDYVLAASRNFWIGMAARVFRPGCQLDNMVVLEGAQGIGKTKALRSIGGPWYTEAKESVTSREFFLTLHGRLLVEVAELDAFNRAEVTRIKQVVTCTTDRYRSPYARGAQDHPRMSIFVGTTNETAYLRDHTGGRRFWPIRCGLIRLEQIARDREQLYAEGVALFRSGEPWYVMPALSTAKEQEERRQVDEWENIMAEYLVDRTDTTIRDVATHLKFDFSKLDMQSQKRIANVLKTLGWDKVTTKRDGHSVRLWRKAELPFEDPPAPGEPVGLGLN